jgi:histidyl-tRNA synthetase
MTKFIADPIKGFKDISGKNAIIIEKIIKISEDICKKYGCQPLQTPIVEKEELFVKSLGNTTDIVTKEIFRIVSDEKLILRPEQTSSVIRWAIKNRYDLTGQPRVYSYGPMFRHENPQKGRWRQFSQFNVEFINNKNFISDGEILLLTNEIMENIKKALGLKDTFILKINTIGSPEDRKNYSEYLQKNIINNPNFSQEAQDKAKNNPLRVLDTKKAEDLQQLSSLKPITDFLNEESKKQWETLLILLDKWGVGYQWDPYLVRGLDYYNDLVFEWIFNDDKILKGAVLAGGRYDGLAYYLTDKYQLPSVGFALGIDRLTDYIGELVNLEVEDMIIPLVNLDASDGYCLQVAQYLRSQNYNIQILNYKKLQDNLKFIDNNGDYNGEQVIIVGATEEQSNKYIVKNLSTGIQQELLIK